MMTLAWTFRGLRNFRSVTATAIDMLPFGLRNAYLVYNIYIYIYIMYQGVDSPTRSSLAVVVAALLLCFHEIRKCQDT